jgi:hypothetical protein
LDIQYEHRRGDMRLARDSYSNDKKDTVQSYSLALADSLYPYAHARRDRGKIRADDLYFAIYDKNCHGLRTR